MHHTSLYTEYESTAKIVDFHGWALPVQFSGILQEHHHTRTKAGLFDCSHMGEFTLQGAAALRAFDALVFSDMLGLKVGRCRYTGLLNDQGRIIDDCVALKLAEGELYVVTNAGPLEKVAARIAAAAPSASNVSAGTSKIDLQGPCSRDILLDLGIAETAALQYWTGARAHWNGEDIIVTRAGYTGELGYELFVPNAIAPRLWAILVSYDDVMPCGLGARDTLRTEMGYPLSGQDVTEATTPIEGGMARFIAWDSDFPGKKRLEALRASGGYAVLTAIKSRSRRAPRPGFEVRHEGRVVGTVTSGTFGPSVGCGVGLAYLPPHLTAPGTGLTAGPHDLEIEAVESPMYTGGTCRMKVA